MLLHINLRLQYIPNDVGTVKPFCNAASPSHETDTKRWSIVVVILLSMCWKPDLKCAAEWGCCGIFFFKILSTFSFVAISGLQADQCITWTLFFSAMPLYSMQNVTLYCLVEKCISGTSPDKMLSWISMYVYASALMQYVQKSFYSCRSLCDLWHYWENPQSVFFYALFKLDLCQSIRNIEHVPGVQCKEI